MPIVTVAIFSIKLSFDYLVETTTDELLWKRVVVPLGKNNKAVVGIIIAVNTNPSKWDLKTVLSIIDNKPLFNMTLGHTLQWASDYYATTLAKVLSTALPQKLRQGLELVAASPTQGQYTGQVQLNTEQQSCWQILSTQLEQFKVYLLQGVTGSGKTEVYFQAISKVLALGKQALVVVPEISLTPELLKRFGDNFQANIILLHSRLSAKERAINWALARDGQANIIIGTRLSVFVPLLNPGIYIVDEEHDPSFKQQEGFGYHARDFLIKRAQLENIPIILGSATPSVESLHNSNNGKYTRLALTKRALQQLPELQIIDIRHNKLKFGLSAYSIKTIEQYLSLQQQVLIFINKRGFAPALFCFNCGQALQCTNCSSKMVLHKSINSAKCHDCFKVLPLPINCRECSIPLQPVGIGTEKLELGLQELFPLANVIRIDKDVTQKKDSWHKLIQSINDNSANIIIGTQMLAKGHNFPHLGLVIILDTDNALYSADFRATERMSQLITQVAGRAGRQLIQGKVILQTLNPEHAIMPLLLHLDYNQVAEFILKERQELKLPPFSQQLLFKAVASNMAVALNELSAIKNKLSCYSNIRIYGPLPANKSLLKKKYRALLLLEADSIKPLQAAIKGLSISRNVSYQISPIAM